MKPAPDADRAIELRGHQIARVRVDFQADVDAAVDHLLGHLSGFPGQRSAQDLGQA
jgi:hypothetical protein